MFTGKKTRYRLVSFITVLCILFSAFQPVTVFARSAESLERKSNAEWMSARSEPVQQDQDATPTDTPVPTEMPLPIETPVPVETSLPVDAPASTDAPSSEDVIALAVTLYVKASGGSDANTCLSVALACATINGAIGKAADGDTIRVATGTYTGTGTEVVLISKNVTLSGGWNAGFTTQSGASTIDGQIARRGVVVNSDITATIGYFIVQSGYTSDLGGGIINLGTLTLANTIVSGNTALLGGGGISNNNAGGDGPRLLILNNSVISSNSATHFGSSGGGVRNGYNSTIILNNSLVSGNTVASGGCGDGAGGGIFIADSNDSIATLNNSTVSGNTSCNSGGGIFSRGVLILNNSTISNNDITGGGNGGGISVENSVTLQNTIIAGNSLSYSRNSPDCDARFGISQTIINSQGYNLIGNSSGCFMTVALGDLKDTNPGLTPLQDNGGSSFTHALMAGSPAINAGNPAAPGSGGNACLATDQRGISRPVSTACDIGAFEGQVPAIFVNISGNAGVAGATLSYTDGTLKTVTADSSGNYSFETLSGWSGTVTPSKLNYTFTPVNRTYSYVVTNQTSQNYTVTLAPLIQDPSFEAYTPNPYWAETSMNFGTPLCIPTFCGLGGGTAAPRTGLTWGWFGGVPVDETATLSQTINIPSGIPDLRLNFYFWIGAAAPGSDAGDRFVVWIDGMPVFLANATQISSYASYTLVSVDVSAYSDGASHTITFSSETTGQLVTFNLDDVTLGLPTIACDETTGSIGVAMNMQDEQLVLGLPSNNVASVNGGSTTGVFRPGNGLLYLKNTNTTGFADVAINYGTGGDYPITGDWDGNGTDTIGIYRNGVFYLRNSNTVGFADIVFAFGAPGDQPVAGDWDGDGVDTIGVYRSSAIAFCLRNSNSAGASDTSFLLGIPGDIGIAGDWNGDGMDTTGVFRPSNGIIFLKNANTSGFADVALNYGLSGDHPVIGDWNNDGIDTIGVYRNATFYLRNSNTIGFADLVFALGNPGDVPISGNWDGIP
jgi:hypothetical protein